VRIDILGRPTKPEKNKNNSKQKSDRREMQGRMSSIARRAAAAPQLQQKRFFMSKFYDIFVNVSPSAFPHFPAGGIRVS